MATQVTYVGDGATVTYAIPFDYSTDGSDLNVTVDAVPVSFSLDNASTLRLAAPPRAGAGVRVFRKTPFENLEVVFADSSILSADDLNGSAAQLFRRVQEVADDNLATAGRALTAPEGEVFPSLPNAAQRAGAALVFDADGNPVAKAIGSFPAGPAGTSDNTYPTLAALLGSDPLRKSARLVPEAGETEPPGNFNYINGAWRRQSADGIAVAPTMGSSRVFGTADATLRADIDVTAEPFNLRPDTDEDQGPALSAAIAAWKAEGGERRRIVLPAGKIRIDTCVDVTGINAGYFGNILSGENRNLTIAGAGRDQTVLIGGEPGFGFMEVTDSSALVLEDFTIHAPNGGADQCQYGILGGRTTGNASSGFIQMRRISVTGRFTKWPIFLMSVENSQLIEPVIWSVLGNGIALAMNNSNHGMVPKYLPLGSGLGGNGANLILSPWMASLNLATPESRLMLLEFSQDAVVQNAYFVSSHAKAHIRLGKRATMHLDGAQHEYDPFASGLPGALDPISVEFAGGTGEFDPTYDIPEYRCTKISNSRLRSIYGESGSKVVGLDLDSSNVLKSFHDGYALNFDTLKDSCIGVSKTLLDAAAVPARADIRIRKENGGNAYGAGIARNDVVAPFPSLDYFTDPESGQAPGTTGLSTVPGVSVGNSGMTAYVPAPGTSSFGLYVDWTVPDLSNLTERSIVGIGTGQVVQGGIGTVSMALYGGQLLMRTFGDAEGQIDYRGTFDAGFVAKFKGKRVRMLMRRAAGATAPKLTIDGCEVMLGRTNGSGASLWDKPVTGNWLQVGYQSDEAMNNCPAIYHAVAYLNYAPTDAEASEMTRFGLLPSQRWGEASGTPTGCIGYWDMAEGNGSRVLDASPLGQHGTIIGLCARLQGPPEHLEGSGSPVGAVYPRKIGDNYLNKDGVGSWYKSTGLGNTNWQAL